jgi:hypothetical protein
VPVVDTANNPDAIEELKEQLLDIIISKRIVKEEDIDTLFDKTKAANDLNEDEYTKIIQEIKAEIGYEEAQ